MNIWASVGDIEKYVMTKIVELDKQNATEKWPSPIKIGSIIPDVWLSSNVNVILTPSNNSCDIGFAKRLSPPVSDIMKEKKQDFYAHHLLKALLIVVALLERLNAEKHIILIRNSTGRTSNTLVLGSILTKDQLDDNPYTVNFPEFIEKLIFLMEKDIVPMTSFFNIVENDFKSEHQLELEAQASRHVESLEEQKRQNSELIKQQEKSFRLAMFSITLAALSLILSAIGQFRNTPIDLIDDPVNVKVISSSIDSLSILSMPKISMDTLVVKTLARPNTSNPDTSKPKIKSIK